MASHQEFELTAGGIMGRDHRLASRNCQDDWYIAQDDVRTIGVVADGCGSGAHSEVGAQLGVRLTVQAIDTALACRRLDHLDWNQVHASVVAALETVARTLASGNTVYRQIVEDYFLFTIVGVVLADGWATFFAIGDGIVTINGETICLGPFPGNAPPYIGYCLMADEASGARPECDVRIIRQVPLRKLDSFLIGTDGVHDLIGAEDYTIPGMEQTVGGIGQFWQHDRYYRNPELTHRQLKLIARDWPRRDPWPGLLPDDTTLIAGRRLDVTIS